MIKLVQPWHKDMKYWSLVLLVVPIICILIFVFSYDVSVGQIFYSPFDFFYLIVLLPCIEEFAFRGWIQGLLLKHSLGRENVFMISYANLATSGLFGLAHLVHQSGFWSILVFFPSLAFGFLRDKFGAIRPSIELHIFYNFVYFLIFYDSTS
jgi:membrane protease YdiL (CAAX protease family)